MCISFHSPFPPPATLALAKRAAGHMLKDIDHEKSLKEPGAPEGLRESPEAGMQPTREPLRLGHNKRPIFWHLLCLEAGLECHEAGPGSSSERIAFLPGSCSQAHTNPGRAETGSVCTADRLSPLLPLPGWSRGERAAWFGFKFGPESSLIWQTCLSWVIYL